MACLYFGIVAVMGRGRTVLTGKATRFIAGEMTAQKVRNGWSLDDIEARTGVPRSTVDRALDGEHTPWQSRRWCNSAPAWASMWSN